MNLIKIIDEVDRSSIKIKIALKTNKQKIYSNFMLSQLFVLKD